MVFRIWEYKFVLNILGLYSFKILNYHKIKKTYVVIHVFIFLLFSKSYQKQPLYSVFYQKLKIETYFISTINIFSKGKNKETHITLIHKHKNHLWFFFSFLNVWTILSLLSVFLIIFLDFLIHQEVLNVSFFGITFLP